MRPSAGLATLAIRSRPQIPAQRTYCNDRLGDYKVPRYIVFEPSPLPRLATGKLSKRELKDRYADAAATLTKVR